MKRLVLTVFLAASLIGCQSIDLSVLQKKVDALDEKVLSGQSTPVQVLPSYESLYQKYKGQPAIIGAYADALRRAGQPKEAAELLKPFIKGKKLTAVQDPIFMAYARLLLDQGYYKDAEKRLMERLTQSPQSSAPQINNLLGIALAGQKRRAEASQAFRRALESWDGRPGIVEKNLARLQGK
jgi:Flp pilus assembly protein TadD